MKAYQSLKQETVEKVAAAGGSRMTFNRRPVLDLPMAPPRAADEAAEPPVPGAEFEPVSPLDVPAFLRRS